MLKRTGQTPARKVRIGSSWVDRWTPFLRVLFLSSLIVTLTSFILSADNVIGSNVPSAVAGTCLIVLFAGDAWSVRKASNRSDD